MLERMYIKPKKISGACNDARFVIVARSVQSLHWVVNRQPWNVAIIQFLRSLI